MLDCDRDRIVQGLGGVGAGQELARRTRRFEGLTVALCGGAFFGVEEIDRARNRHVGRQRGDNDGYVNPESSVKLTHAQPLNAKA